MSPIVRVLAGLALPIVVAVVAPAAQAAMRVVSEGKSATLLRTDEFVLHSEEIGRDFVVEVTQAENLPPGQRPAVVYALDGGFGVAGTTARILTAGNRMAPAVVVSIGYPNSNSRHFGPREIDLLHETVTFGARTLGGGGGAFEAFLMNDVRPFVEARYAIDSARSVLIGHSAGGLFAAHLLVNRPEAFSGYVIGSVPVNGYGAGLVENTKAIAAKGDGRRVFIGLVPDDIVRLGSDQFGAVLTGKSSTFVAHQELFEGESHTSSYLQLVSKGLPFVLPTSLALRTAVKVPRAVIDRYAGAYTAPAGTILVSREKDALLVRMQPSGAAILQPESPTQFFSPTVNTVITFTMGPDGKATALVMRSNGIDTTATRESQTTATREPQAEK